MSMPNKPICILTVDVEALPMRAPDNHVDKLIYGYYDSGEWGIGRMMDIADSHGVKMTFFLDFAEVELYGDQILQTGQYITSRGHDLQIHCHYKLLEEKVREQFPNAGISYYTWYEDDEISDYMLDYCLKQYQKCTQGIHQPVIFRGGEYRFEKALLKNLKKQGFAADASYNYIRPLRKPIHKQFVFENGLLELPVGILPEQEGISSKPLNFNAAYLYPTQAEEIDKCLQEYEKLFCCFYNYYGNDTIATILMHSWSFCHEKSRSKETGYIDRPNPYATEFFDHFLTYFKEKLNFITASKAVETNTINWGDTVKFETVFSLPEHNKLQNKLEQIEAFIRQKAAGRTIVIWGKGWIEARIMRVRELHLLLDAAFYISRDAADIKTWRGKPVITFEEANISPSSYYVLLIANTCFPDIRKTLQDTGFHKDSDYYDIAKHLPTIP